MRCDSHSVEECPGWTDQSGTRLASTSRGRTPASYSGRAKQLNGCVVVIF